MRFIYSDEAGTDEGQNVIVVVGLILHADQQWLPAFNELRRVIATVPAHYSHESFISHASAIWGSEKFRNRWGREQRKQFLLDMMSIPKRLGIPIALSYERKALVPSKGRMDPLTGKAMDPEVVRHVRVFAHCISVADMWIQKFAKPEEVAVLVAEDLPEKRMSIRNAVNLIRLSARMVDAPRTKEVKEIIEKTSMRMVTPIIIRKVVDTVHFVEKHHGPLLQIADACAFGLRRFLSQQSEGESFAEAIMDSGLLRQFDLEQPSEWTVIYPASIQKT